MHERAALLDFPFFCTKVFTSRARRASPRSPAQNPAGDGHKDTTSWCCQGSATLFYAHPGARVCNALTIKCATTTIHEHLVPGGSTRHIFRAVLIEGRFVWISIFFFRPFFCISAFSNLFSKYQNAKPSKYFALCWISTFIFECYLRSLLLLFFLEKKVAR